MDRFDAELYEKALSKEISRRDYFAGLAMQALIAKSPLAERMNTDKDGIEKRRRTVAGAQLYADEMIAYLDSCFGVPKDEAE